MEPVFSGKDDTLETIYEKISSQNTLEEKLKVHTLFQLTRPDIINHINMFIQVKDQELWKDIKRRFYPSLFDKIKSWFS
jgi:hypothetical protein